MPAEIKTISSRLDALDTFKAGVLMLECATDAQHPNRLKFKGVLVTLDEPSTKAPHGSHGHLIQLPAEVAAKRLDSLVGMGVNYAENLDAHDPQFKVGVIEQAWINGKNLMIAGYVWVQDFPDAQKVLSQGDMGMSMELTRVKVEDMNAKVWMLSDCIFTGATFLRKSKAAYFDTSAKIAASGDSTSKLILQLEASEMANENGTQQAAEETVTSLTPEQQELANVTAAAATAALTKALGPVLASIGTAVESVNTTNKTLLEKIAAAEQEQQIAAAKGDDKGKDDDTDNDGNDDWDGDDDDSDDVDAAKLAARWKARAMKAHGALSAAEGKVQAAEAESERLRAANTERTAQVQAAAAKVTRATLSSEGISLLQKNGIDATSMLASGQTMDTADIDACFRNLDRPLDPEQRMQIKLNLQAAGLMKAPEANSGARRTR